MKRFLIFFLIFAIGAFFRFYGLNWDQNQHLHPDERFLTMVGNAMQIPNNFADYLNPQVSTFNPANLNYKFFVYGTLPLTVNKLLAVVSGNDTYNGFTLQGRFLSGLFDLLIILFIYKTVLLFEEKYKLHTSIKYWASFFYAIAVLPIQLSHFFAVDTFLNFFMFASFYFALRFSFYHQKKNLVASAILFGSALASKISAIYMLPLNLILIISTVFSRRINIKSFTTFFTNILIYTLLVYVLLRLADPYLFQHNDFLNPILNQTFIANLQSLKSFEGKEVRYPPGVQWINKPPIVFGLINLAIFGIGLPYALCIAGGVFFLLRKYKSIFILAMLFWVGAFFTYQSSQFAKTMRYFIFLYPFLAILAGVGFYYSTQSLNKMYRIAILLLILIWPMSFLSIYTKPHSRVAASEWMYEQLKDESVILGEHWDDPLPLHVTRTYGKTFQVELLPVFDPDTPEKWEKMNELLQKADYYVLSSNRAWGSIPTVPEKYPRMSQFYEDLFGNRAGYTKIKEFSSYPSLRYLGIPIDFPDDWADESFTVYDHPKAMIFKNNHLRAAYKNFK